ncbi:MAG: putative beta-lysine N-acetyltransferase [Candidatus Omnitrophica bacterium]|nr:putative beta-lysine N-acetyltransferase [Candidatus Omnitrophota bacterium]
MLIQDKIEEMPCGSLIQHGPYNDRIYLIKLGNNFSEESLQRLISLAKTNKYSKIFAKIPTSAANFFFNSGFLKEAEIPYFFSGKQSALFMGLYLTSDRMKETTIDLIKKNLKIALEKTNTRKALPLNNKFFLRKCYKSDVFAMAKIYNEVFPSYPFPINDPTYLLKTMQTHIDYFGIETNGSLIAISSAEVDRKAANAEMTDFATLQKWRGNSFGQYLLAQMETKMKKKDIKTSYTIARAMSAGINITFSKAGYKYCGKLKNNTNISGKIESMNVWYKSL